MALSATLGGFDLTTQDSFGVQWTVAQLDGEGASASTIEVVQKPRANGGWAGTAFLAPRHLALSGLIIAPDQANLVAALDRLNVAASLGTTPLTVVEAGQTRIYQVRREDVVIFQYVTDVIATWSVQFVCLDARKFGNALTGSTFLPASTGGLTWGHAWPETWTATTISGTVSLTNPGNAAGPVVLRIDGPTTGPQIAHTSAANASIVTFSSSLVLGAGEWLTVNMDTRQALANDQSNRAAYITSRGWSQFDPGVNTWSFSASSYNALSKLTVSATPAWI